MRYAYVGGVKVEAQPTLIGTCRNCGGELIAKCGRVKVWHWAHKGNPQCDPWWESETEWHRGWKDKFPKEWQEVIHFDPVTGEKHIADVKNPFGLVVEFQHSPISPAEMQAREEFYGEMVWIVDGLRGDLDKSHFDTGLNHSPIQKNPLAYSVHWWGRSRLLHNWGEAKAKVFLDFGDEHLWRLVTFNPDTKRGAVGPLARTALLEDCLTGTTFRVSAKD